MQNSGLDLYCMKLMRQTGLTIFAKWGFKSSEYKNERNSK